MLSRYLDAVAIRTYSHAELEVFEAAATVPVVNALTDEAHPLQALADLQTMRERFGAVEGLRVAWIGDGNNVCLSLAEACALLGAELVCAAPPGYEPDDASIPVVRDPREAAAGAHVVVTDVWTSMGQEAESAERLRAFAGYTVDDELLALADPDAIVLHCLPAHPGEEISAPTSSTGPQCAAWDEAENRLHTSQGAPGADRLARRARQREKTSSRSARIARGTSTKSRSPGSTDVEPRGGIVSSPRVITAISASRGRPSSRTAEPAIAWLPDDDEVDEVELAQVRRPRAARRAPAAPARAARAGRRPTRASCPARSSTRRRRRRRR